MKLGKLIQIVIAYAIFVLLIISIVKLDFYEYGGIILILILIQTNISLWRRRVLNILFEVPLIMGIALSFIPFIGIVFQVLSLFPAFLDLAAHHFGQERFTVINARYMSPDFREKREREKVVKKKVKSKPKFKDAEFKEK